MIVSGDDRESIKEDLIRQCCKSSRVRTNSFGKCRQLSGVKVRQCPARTVPEASQSPRVSTEGKAKHVLQQLGDVEQLELHRAVSKVLGQHLAARQANVCPEAVVDRKVL